MNQLQTIAEGANGHMNIMPLEREIKMQEKVVLRLVPRSVTLTLSLITALLLIAHLGIVALGYLGNMAPESYDKLRHFFHFNDEENLPTFFSSILLFFAAALFFIIGKLQSKASRNNGKWLLLGAVMLFLCLDESLQIHERVNTVTRSFIKNDVSGFLFWAWILPYTILFVLVSLYFLKFYLQLPKKTKVLFFIAAALYFFGAVVIESIEGHFGKIYPSYHPIFVFTITIQELLEMVGVIVLIHALLDYIAAQFKEISLTQ
jgi:drug/metabolite transporter superfamily protein YnfA